MPAKLCCRSHSKFVKVCFADYYCPGFLQSPDNSRVVRRDIAIKHLGSTRSPDALCGNVVLDTNGNSCKRASLIAIPDLLVKDACPLDRFLTIDCHQGVYPGLYFFYPL